MASTQALGPQRTRVLELHRAGLTGYRIGKALGISKQRVYQHLKALREAGIIR
jgi:DNA-binding transcriptional ArsR family regulator